MWRESGWWYGGNALSALTHVKYVCQGLARPPESQSIIPTPSSLSLWMSISDQACGIVLRTTTKKNNTDKVLLNFTCPRCPSQENTVHQKFMCPLSSVNLVICLRLVVKEVLYTSDPDMQGRCSVSVPLQANCVWGLCVWWVELEKKKDNPKISLLLALCRNISEPAPPNIKMGSTRVHNIWPHLLAIASSSRRHVVMSKASPTRLFLGSSCAKVTAAPSGVTFASYQQCKMSWFRASFVLNGPTKKACY